ncbi:MAG: hypothetical protein ACQEWF_23105 [Bacillota bacterium]
MKKKISFCITLVTMLWASLITVASAEDIDWNKKLYQGRDISYWIAPGNEYTVSIPSAVTKLMYPSGMTNPIILNKTTVNQSSKMDFYQYDAPDNVGAKTAVFKKNASGVYYKMPSATKDNYDWIYGEIKLNDYYLKDFSTTNREKIILHEMLHVYGLKDLYDESNKWSIMYYGTNSTATGLTSDANAVLNAKY